MTIVSRRIPAVLLTTSVALSGVAIAASPAQAQTADTDKYISSVEKSKDGYTFTIHMQNSDKTHKIDLSQIKSDIKTLRDKQGASKTKLEELEGKVKTFEETIDQISKDQAAAHETLLKEITAKETEIKTLIGDLKKEIDKVDNKTVVQVEENKGVYKLKLKDGSYVKGQIDTSGNVVSITNGANGSLVVKTRDGKTTTVKLPQLKVTTSKDGKTTTITTPDGKSATLSQEDKYISKVTKQANGDYVVERNDGQKWTVSFADLRKRIADLEKNSATKEDAQKLQGEVDKLDKRIDKLAGETASKFESVNKEIGTLRGDIGKLDGRITGLENSVVKEIRDNKDGTFTIIRVDGKSVPGVLGSTSTIRKIAPTPDGGLEYTTADGKKHKVALKQLTWKEEHKGTPKHTITLTTPDGKSLVMNMFDMYVTTVERLDNGDYIVKRNDGKSWTISLVELRNQIFELKNKAEQLEKSTQEQGDSTDKALRELQREITDLQKVLDTTQKDIATLDSRVAVNSKRIEDITGRIESIDVTIKDHERLLIEHKKRIDRIDEEIVSIQARITGIRLSIEHIEGRIAGIESTLNQHDENIAQLQAQRDYQRDQLRCYQNIGLAAIPLALAGPIIAGSSMEVPGIAEANIRLQKQLGLFQPEIANMVNQNKGVLQTVAAVAGVLVAIGVGMNTYNNCKPYLAKKQGLQPPAEEGQPGEADPTMTLPETEILPPVGGEATTAAPTTQVTPTDTKGTEVMPTSTSVATPTAASTSAEMTVAPTLAPAPKVQAK